MMRLAKSFYIAVFSFVIACLYLSLKEIKNTQLEIHSRKILETQPNLEKVVEKENDAKKSERNEVNNIENVSVVKSEELKYILQWTKPNNVPFVYMGVGQKGFIERNCEYTNCFVTSDRNYLGNVSAFDVIAFAGPEVSLLFTEETEKLPSTRSPHQKYAFASIESASNYPVCSDASNNFFNWTWTYKLDSEAKWGYIIVRNADGNIIGPKKDMNWMKLEDMDPVSDELASQLRSKSRTAAWFVSNCVTHSGRENYVKRLKSLLRIFDLKVDVYGKCGTNICDRSNEEKCFEMIKRDYYFYLSFENAFSEDYVTEKLLHGLKYNAIPIVFGGANYTRFMPDGIYLNAMELGPKELAKKMKYLIDNPEEYKQYFRWKNHYSYYRKDENATTNDYCGFCKLLNDKEKVKKTSIYKDFKGWWNEPGGCIDWAEFLKGLGNSTVVP